MRPKKKAPKRAKRTATPTREALGAFAAWVRNGQTLLDELEEDLRPSWQRAARRAEKIEAEVWSRVRWQGDGQKKIGVDAARLAFDFVVRQRINLLEDRGYSRNEVAQLLEGLCDETFAMQVSVPRSDIDPEPAG